MLLLLMAGAAANLAVVWGVLRHELRDVRERLSDVRRHVGLPSQLVPLK